MSANPSSKTATQTAASNAAPVKRSIGFFLMLFGIALFLPYSIYVVLFNNPSVLGGFAYHPPLGAIALSAMAYGISVLQSARNPDAVGKALTLHGLFVGLIAGPCILTAATIMYQRKETNGQPHYTSWHGILGSAVALGAIFQATFGTLLAEGYLPRKYYKYHRRSGYVLFTLMAFTPALGGLFSSFIVQHAWTASRFLAYGLGPLLVWVGVMGRIRPARL